MHGPARFRTPHWLQITTEVRWNWISADVIHLPRGIGVWQGGGEVRGVGAERCSPEAVPGASGRDKGVLHMRACVRVGGQQRGRVEGCISQCCLALIVCSVCVYSSLSVSHCSCVHSSLIPCLYSRPTAASSKSRLDPFSFSSGLSAFLQASQIGCLLFLA